MNFYDNWQKLNMWNPIYTLNLTNHTDPEFKIVQIMEIGNHTLIVDLRETNKGRKTKTGVFINVAEFEWFKNCMNSDENKTFTLEHGNKTIKIEKSNNQVIINLSKYDGAPKKITLETFELLKLVDNLNDIEAKLLSHAKSKGIKTKFEEHEYTKLY